jgi:hypothetical protein
MNHPRNFSPGARAFMTVFGAPADTWETVEPVREVMSRHLRGGAHVAVQAPAVEDARQRHSPHWIRRRKAVARAGAKSAARQGAALGMPQ